jgi:hypothetical protein
VYIRRPVAVAVRMWLQIVFSDQAASLHAVLLDVLSSWIAGTVTGLQLLAGLAT